MVTLVWAVRRLLSGPGRRTRPDGQTDAVPKRAEGEMVRDRICNTYLPRPRALTVEGEEGQHFFCSERCRQIHLARKAG